MNPFDRLRKAVEKIQINYTTPENDAEFYETGRKVGGETQYLQDDEMIKTKQNMSQISNQQSKQLKAIILQQQTNYIQQINQLSIKCQRLTKNLKTAQMEKNQLIQQICGLEKNNESLQQKVNELAKYSQALEDRERKYKEEIHRINSTIDMLGSQLSTERSARKNIIKQFDKYKQQSQIDREEQGRIKQNLQDKIKRLEQEISERTNLLEYNIGKNAEERNKNRSIVDKLREQMNEKIKNYEQNERNLRQQTYQLTNDKNLLESRYENICEKKNQLQKQNAKILSLNQEGKALNQQLQQTLEENSQKINQLIQENQDLQRQLENEKQNIKVKVIEVKDETLELQLEMYKRQCKDLLQEKIIVRKIADSSSLTNGVRRNYEPMYQVISQQQHYRTKEIENNDIQ